MSSSPSTLHAQQRALTRHLRDPLRYPSPAGMNATRVKVYRELIPANLISLLGGTFPVLVSILGESSWTLLVKRFLRDAPSHTPLFSQISVQFVAFLSGLDPASVPASCWRPFMVELAHYEWVEVNLMQREAEPLDQIDESHAFIVNSPSSEAALNQLDHSLLLSPLAWPLAYTWPVHRLGPDYQPTQEPEAPTLLLVRRDPDDMVRFSELNPLAWHLLQRISQHPRVPARALLQQLGIEASPPDMATFMTSAEMLVNDLVAQRVIAFDSPHTSVT